MSRHEGFAPIPTWMIRDANVSIFALTVYASLSSRSGLREIIPGRDTLAKEARCSVRQVARALVELEELGVVQRVRRTSKTGRASNGYTLHPNGSTGVEDSQSQTPEVEDSEDLGKGLREPGYGTGSAFTPLLGRDSEAEIDKAESAPTFDDFYAAWPRKMKRPDALKAWTRALKEHRATAERIVAAAVAYRDNPGIPEKRFIPYPASWLNADGWNDELPGGRGGKDDSFRDTIARGQRLEALAQQRGIAS